ncbi:MAG: GNAT family protein [Terrimesophilobacter sp.]
MELQSLRLILHRIEQSEAQAIVDGSGRDGPSPGGGSWHPDYPLDAELDPLRVLATATNTPTDFTLYQMRLRISEVAIGGIGFFGPPDSEGTVEVGFGLVEAERGKGLATESIKTMIEFAKRSGARRIRADTAVDNLASQRVLQKAGFAQTHRTGGPLYFQRDLGS